MTLNELSLTLPRSQFPIAFEAFQFFHILVSLMDGGSILQCHQRLGGNEVLQGSVRIGNVTQKAVVRGQGSVTDVALRY